MSAATPTAESPSSSRSLSYGERVRRELLANRLAMVGLSVVVMVTIVAVLCPLLANQRPLYVRAVFIDDYYSSLAICLEQVTLAMEEPLPDGVTENDLAKDFALHLAELRRHLGEEHAGTLDRAEVDFSVALAGGDDEAAGEALVALESLFDAEPGPVTRYPAFRALTTAEIYTLFSAPLILLTFLVRFGSWTARLVVALVVAGVATAGVRTVYPAVQDTRPYRDILSSPGFEEAGGVAILTPIPYGENENIIEDARQPPTWMLAPEDRPAGRTHWLGTDTNGRDVLARMVYGARVSMLIGIVAVAIYTLIGILVGAIAGYFGGWTDILVSRVIEVVICFPPLLLILAVQVFLPRSLFNIVLALAALWWTGIARLQRAEFLRLVNMDYVMAVRALGGSNARIIFLHILPNGLGPILVMVSFGIAGSILVESGLSFLGFGVPQPMASWGDLLNNGRNDYQGLWWLTIFPGLAIFLTVTCFNLIGEGLRDALDPRGE